MNWPIAQIDVDEKVVQSSGGPCDRSRHEGISSGTERRCEPRHTRGPAHSQNRHVVLPNNEGVSAAIIVGRSARVTEARENAKTSHCRPVMKLLC